MPSEQQLRYEIVRLGRMMHERGFTAACDGNLSCRLDERRMLLTPSGLCKGMLEAEDLVVADLSGHKLEGRHGVSSETAMHVLIYRVRPDVNAVVHAHPPTATGFAVAGIAMDAPVLAEMLVSLGSVPVAPYGTPGTPELAAALEPHVAEHDAVLMANHGVVCCGPDLVRAYLCMELVEHAAKLLLVARQLGGAQELNPEETAKLRRQRDAYGVPAEVPVPVRR